MREYVLNFDKGEKIVATKGTFGIVFEYKGDKVELNLLPLWEIGSLKDLKHVYDNKLDNSLLPFLLDVFKSR